MRIRLAIPDRLVTAPALEAALEAVSLANAEAMKRGELPTVEDAIASGARWRPERFVDGEHFDMGHQIVRRKWGDCDDWAPMLTGQLLASGQDPGARTRVIKTGPDRWHAVTQTSDGEILDPSRWAGMGRRSGPTNPGVSGRLARPMARQHGGALCVVPSGGHWWARCDVPWHDGSGHLASHARASTPEQALERAVCGAVECGEQLPSPLIERARGVGMMLLTPVDELIEQEGEVGSLFGRIFHSITHPSLKGLLNIANPAMALSYHSLHDKSFAPLRSVASSLPIPGAQFLSSAPGLLDSAEHMLPGASSAAPSALRALAYGGGRADAPGAIPDPRGSGAVSVPLESATDPSPHGQHVFLYFHPKGHPGPVVMRF